MDRKKYRILVDSGSSYSLISEAFANRLNLEINTINNTTKLFAAEGSNLNILGSAEMYFNVAGLNVEHTFLVVTNLAETWIIGTDFLEKYHCVLDFVNGVISIEDNLACAALYNPGNHQSYARLVKPLCLKPFSETIVMVACAGKFYQRDVMLEPIPGKQFDRFAVAGSLGHVEKGHTHCRILNHNPYCVVLPKNTKVAVVSAINVLRQCTPWKQPSKLPNAEQDEVSVVSLEQFATEYGFGINPDLTSDQRIELLRLLYKYRTVFARDISEIKQYPHYSLKLRLRPDAKPFYRRQFRLSEADTLEAHNQIQQLSAKRLIEPSNESMYNSPIFLVDRPNGRQRRLIVDLRQANLAVQPYNLQLPDMSETLNAMADQNARYFTSVDLTSGFHQIKLADDGLSRDITTFTDPLTKKRWRYTVCPFGLAASPSAMIIAVMSSLSHLLGSDLIRIYSDDISITSTSFDQHQERLELLLKSLEVNCLSLNPKKSVFAHKELKYLGFVVSAEGLRISDDKIKLVKSLPIPKTTKQLQRTLGIFQFLRKFINGYSHKTHHMRQNLIKGHKFNWTEECDAEFKSLIEAITTAPILQSINSNKPFTIYTDSSYQGAAYAVFQEGPDGLPHPVGYGGKALTSSQLHWSVMEIELFAVSLALKDFQSYIGGQIVTVFSDNISVVFLKNLAFGKPREKRMACFLSQFNLILKHIPGHKNTLADTLSRSFGDMTLGERIQFLPEKEIDDFIFTVGHTSEESQPIIDSPNPAAEYEVIKSNAEPEAHLCYHTVLLDDGEHSDQLHNSTARKASQPDSGEQHSSSCTQLSFKRDNIRPGLRSFSASPGASSDNLHSPTLTQSVINSTQTTLNIAPTQDAVLAISNKKPRRRRVQSLSPVSRPTNDQLTDTPSSILGGEGELDTDVAPDPTNRQTDEMLALPNISPDDYMNDTEFSFMYSFLRDGILPADPSKAKFVTLLSEDFILEDNGLLYRVTIPRNKKSTLVGVQRRLCIPKRFRVHILKTYHDKFLNHFGREKTYLTLRQRFYYKDLYQDCIAYVKTCAECLKNKRHYHQITVPLNPLQTPTKPFTHWQADHLVLPRKTDEGHTAILVLICAFSKLPIIRLVKTQSAFETAQVFVESVVANYGLPSNVTLMTDKGSAFCSKFFRFVTKALNVRLVSSAVQISRSNGLAESCVKAVKNCLPFHDNNDLQLRWSIPLVELALKLTVNPSTGLSPFEIVFGVKGEIPDVSGVQPFSPQGSTPSLWFQEIQKRLQNIHETVSDQLKITKETNMQQYNKRHKVDFPTWQIGDRVLISDRRIKDPQRVLTKSRFDGGYVITNIVSNEQMGPAYRLTRLSDGKSLRNLIGHDRLKLDTSIQRADFLSKYNPPLQSQTSVVDDKPTNNSDEANSQADSGVHSSEVSQNSPEFTNSSVDNGLQLMTPALRVIRERRRGRRIEYYVEFESGERGWCDELSPTLLSMWLVEKERKKSNRRRRKRR